MNKLTFSSEATVYKNSVDMPELFISLLNEAENASNCSYSPYSKFQVGAALLLEDSTTITGSNQENAAYPSTLCAERVALFTYGHLHTTKKIKVIAIAARHKESLFGDCSPCGGCRQVMLEYERIQGTPIEVIFRFDSSIYHFASVEMLVPFSFRF